MAAQKYPVLIVGGGIGGMATAFALARKNIRSVVLEQAPEFRKAGAGFQICPNVFKVFDLLGLTAAMMKVAYFPENLVYIDGYTSQEILSIPLGEQIHARFKYPYGLFHREEILQVMLDECLKTGLIELVTSARVVDFEQKSDWVIVKTEQGASFEGEALIGADGIWSTIRERIFKDGPPRASHIAAYRGVIPLEKVPERFQSSNVYHWLKPDHNLIYYQIRHGELFNVVATMIVKRGLSDTFGSREELQRRFKEAPEEIKGLLDMVNRSQSWMICDREPTSEWSQGRITLVGDAAHPALPHLTQGAGMAFEDACVLAHEVDLHKRDYQAAFIAYQKARYLRTARVQLLSRLYQDFFAAKGVARDLRNEMLSKYSVEDCYNWLAWLYEGIELKF